MIKQEINACARFRMNETSTDARVVIDWLITNFEILLQSPFQPELSSWKMCQYWKPFNYLRFCVVLHRLKLTGRKSMPRSIWSFRKKLRDQVPNPIMAEKVYLLCSVNNTLLAFQWLNVWVGLVCIDFCQFVWKLGQLHTSLHDYALFCAIRIILWLEIHFFNCSLIFV